MPNENHALVLPLKRFATIYFLRNWIPNFPDLSSFPKKEVFTTTHKKIELPSSGKFQGIEQQSLRIQNDSLQLHIKESHPHSMKNFLVSEFRRHLWMSLTSPALKCKSANGDVKMQRHVKRSWMKIQIGYITCRKFYAKYRHRTKKDDAH